MRGAVYLLLAPANRKTITGLTLVVGCSKLETEKNKTTARLTLVDGYQTTNAVDQ